MIGLLATRERPKFDSDRVNSCEFVSSLNEMTPQKYIASIRLLTPVNVDYLLRRVHSNETSLISFAVFKTMCSPEKH
jgi:hypothetical protein